MKKIYTIFISFLIFGIFTPFFVLAQAKQDQIKMDFFYSPTCPHCAQEEVFLDKLEKEYPSLKINRFSVFEKENIALLKNFYNEYNVPAQMQGAVPITFTKEKFFLGFSDQVEQGLKSSIEESFNNQEKEVAGEKIKLPLLGKINTDNFSPLLLSIVLGTLDGFNACAMIALAFLLTVLVATGMRKKVLLIGGTFLFVSALVYFLFISAWLNLFLILERLRFITLIVGIVVIIFGILLLKDYLHGVVCKLCQLPGKKDSIWTKIERRLFNQIQKLTNSKMSLPLLLLGVALVAAGINAVELVCSFGFPVAFTKTLTSLKLPTLHYYFYLLIYIIFYMLDDIVVFSAALLNLKITKLSDKYLNFLKLVSGILILILGLIMIFKPGLLTLAK